jgi:hypothetical protein
MSDDPITADVTAVQSALAQLAADHSTEALSNPALAGAVAAVIAGWYADHRGDAPLARDTQICNAFLAAVSDLQRRISTTLAKAAD